MSGTVLEVSRERREKREREQKANERFERNKKIVRYIVEQRRRYGKQLACSLLCAP